MRRADKRALVGLVVGVCGILALRDGARSLAAQQPTGSLSGRVIMRFAKAPESMVHIKRIGDDAERRTSTDTDGRFHFAGLPPGEYQVMTLSRDRPDVVLERVRVDAAETQLAPIELPNQMVICECAIEVANRSKGTMALHFGDGAGHRVLRAYATVKPTAGQSVDPYYNSRLVGPYSICLCGRDPETLGRVETFQLPPGQYVVTAAAAGYRRLTVPVVLKAGKVTDVDLRWEPLDDAADVQRAMGALSPNEVLLRFETVARVEYLAIDATLGADFLGAVDRHDFDGAHVRSISDAASIEAPDGTPFGFVFRAFRDAGLPLTKGAGRGTTTIGRMILPDQGSLTGRMHLPQDREGILAVSRVR